MRPLAPFVSVFLLVASLSPRLAHAQLTAATVGPLVPVHLNGAEGLSLEMQPLDRDPDDVDDDLWRRVCDAPCDHPLPIRGVYRIAGPDTSESDPFRLHDWRDQPAVLDVIPNSSGRRGAGLGLIIGGSIVLGVGVTTLAIDGLLAVVDAGSGTAAAVGGVGVLAGAAMLIGGLGIHPNTAVRQQPAVPAQDVTPPAATPASPATPSAWRLPASSSTPLFTATF